MNPRTQRYQRYGLNGIMDYDQKAAWLRHLQGEIVPLQDLPTNGDQCNMRTTDGICGHPLLIDATCPNSVDHDSRELDVIDVTDAMINAALDAYTSMFPDWEQMRAALIAALRVREATRKEP